MPHRRLSHYTLLERIGEGGMGEVYRARDERLGRTLAVKTLRAGGGADDELRRRLMQEAQAASALNHPSIVTVYDIGSAEDGGLDFIAMEFVDGEPASAALRRGEHGVDLALRIGVPVASALAAAHAAGIVHRDLKPANIMQTTSGQVKLLDFGLAKLTQARVAGADVATTPRMELTTEGMAMGTPAYMAPEQVEGRPADARSDVFALGLLLYELLSGERAFAGGSAMAVMSAILRDAPVPLENRCRGCPAGLARLVAHCLEKDPARRPQDAGAVLAELVRIRADWARRGTLAWRLSRTRVWLPAAVLLVSILGVWAGLAWRAQAAQEAFDAELQALAALAADERLVEAFAHLRALEARHPGHPALAPWWNDLTVPGNLRSEPPGARVWVKSYVTPDAPWTDMGVTDQDAVQMPLAHVRWRVEKAGYEPQELSSPGYFLPQVPMTPVGEAPPGMLRVPAGALRHRWMRPVQLDAFWLGRTEVTNAEFQQFVDAGGYRRPEYWQEPIISDGEILDFESAMALFRDSTGRPAPAGWELGRFPDGTAEHPVTGISWYEASAYARFVGGTLPSATHWTHAARHDNHSDVLSFGNFDGARVEPVGTRNALSPFGHQDMAGNASEWVATESGGLRLVLGGDYASPPYKYADLHPEPPLTRSPHIGMRLAIIDAPMDEALLSLPWHGAPDLPDPVSDEVFETYRRMYGYDPVETPATLESRDESEHWRLEVWRVTSAYGGEPFRVRLYLPKQADPPFQTIVFGPHAGATLMNDSARAGTREFAFLVRSGRAVAFPVYYGTYERRLPPDAGERARLAARANWTRDAGRTLDFLETHPEVDPGAFGYFGVSLGSNVGINILAIESRFRVAVLQAAGLYAVPMPAENNPVHFLPRIDIPVLVLGGSEDFYNPLATSQIPLFERLGTPPEHKKHFVFDGGHVAPRPQELVGVIVDWFDRYLGPVAADD
ncbi:MAG TPA: protein kinase [Xanthomonadaceae bacterium]|nr:protein kinase [Xanthomonadaceae bacterium]